MSIRVVLILCLLLTATAEADVYKYRNQPGEPPKSNGESAPAEASDVGVLTVTNMNGEVFPLIKRQWPVAFRCNKWPSGKFMFSIHSRLGSAAKQAWLIFPDHTGYEGVLHREGLNWRFNWTDPVTDENFSVVVKPDGGGYYYQWDLADDDGRVAAKRTMECR